jgi:hypothetical protein
VHHTTSNSLEQSIKERVKRLLNTEVTDITPLDDLDEQLGPPIDIEPIRYEEKDVDSEEKDLDPENPDAGGDDK